MGVRFAGIEQFKSNLTFVRQVFGTNGHKGVMRSPDGTPLLIITNSNENPVTLPGCPNGIVKIDLTTGQQTCLLSLDWSLAVHITCPDQADFCVVETYSAPGGPWVPYRNELLQVFLDGRPPVRLCHHRSSSATYDSQPKATISRKPNRDGKYLVAFTSDMAGANSVYLLEIDTPAAPTPKPVSLTLEERVAALEQRVGVLESK